MRRLTRVERRSRFATIRAGLIAGIVAFVLFGTSGVAFALWSANTALTSTASTATVTVSQALASGSTLAKTYTSSDLIGVGVVTVTNTGTRSGNYSLVVAGTSSSSTFPAAIGVVIGEGTCTTSSTLTSTASGTMAAAVTKTGALAAGASIALCVRTSITAANVTANSGASLAGTTATSISVGTWSASAATSIAFTQSIAAAAAVDRTGWFWIKTSQTPTQCIYPQYNAENGRPLWQNTCGTAANVGNNELVRFVAATGGYYTMVSKANSSYWWSAPSAAAGQEVQVSNTTTDLGKWLPIVNSDGTTSFSIKSAPTLCLSLTGTTPAAGAFLQLATCSTTAANQKFLVALYEVVVPPAAALACTGDSGGYNVTFSWPELTGYQSSVVYRVKLNGTILAAPVNNSGGAYGGGNGWDTKVRFGSGGSAAALYGTGSKAILVEQSVLDGPWTTTGTGTLNIANSVPFMTCG
jgi:hypothetical protein